MNWLPDTEATAPKLSDPCARKKLDNSRPQVLSESAQKPTVKRAPFWSPKFEDRPAPKLALELIATGANPITGLPDVTPGSRGDVVKRSETSTEMSPTGTAVAFEGMLPLRMCHSRYSAPVYQ